VTGERGAAGLTMVLATVLMVTVGLTVVTAVADLALTSARARAAADAAALAAVTVSPLAGGGVAPDWGRAADPRTVAERLARANHGELVGVQPDGWPLRYGVTVVVEPVTGWVRRLVGPVQAGAVAGLRPRRAPSPLGPSSVTFDVQG
jgi:hypothetical protein